MTAIVLTMSAYVLNWWVHYAYAQLMRYWISSLETLPDYAKGLDDRSENTAVGLANSLRLAGVGSQLPLWDRVGHISAPTLTMAGEMDSKFNALGRQLAAAIGTNAVFRSIPMAGHAAHLEQPFAVVTVIREWLIANKQNPLVRSAQL